jgi:hypothetical protein
MRDLLIYHPGTGTVISLSDTVYLVDADAAGEETVAEMLEGFVEEREHKGFRIDNFNMSNLFYEGAS